MSLATEIETARAWLTAADRELDAVKARRARIIAALKALGDEIEAEVPVDDGPLCANSIPGINGATLVCSRIDGHAGPHEDWSGARWVKLRRPVPVSAPPAPVDEDPVADEMPVAWPV